MKPTYGVNGSDPDKDRDRSFQHAPLTLSNHWTYFVSLELISLLHDSSEPTKFVLPNPITISISHSGLKTYKSFFPDTDCPPHCLRGLSDYRIFKIIGLLAT